MNAMMPKSRLLAINNYFYRRGGAESVFLDHMQMFERAGWDVAPFSMQGLKNLPTRWSSYFPSEIEFGRQEGLATKLSDAGKIIYSREAQNHIERLVRDFRPDIAHAHNVYHHLSPAIFQTLKKQGIPLIMTAHDLKIVCPAYTMLSNGHICEKCKGGNITQVLTNRCMKGSAALSGLILLETAIHRALGLYRNTLDRVVAPSRFYRDKIIEWGWPADRIVYIPNFVDPSFVHETPAAEEDYFVFAGRLSREKGIATLIDAIGATGQKLVVAGTGPDADVLKAKAAALGANVSFVGHVSGAPLRQLIGGAKALVLPSEWYENAPISVLEAYGLGRPVIGAEIGGIPELVRSEETGLLAKSGNAESLGAALQRMDAIGPGGRRRMGLAGRDWVLANFSAQAYQDRMIELYGELVH